MGVEFPDGGSRLYAVAAALTIFPGRAPADPMKVHDVLFTAFRTHAFHLALVVVDHGFGLFAEDRPGGFRDGFFRSTAFGGWHKNTPWMLTMTHGPLGVRRLRAMMY